jgi:proline iminopeptidase
MSLSTLPPARTTSGRLRALLLPAAAAASVVFQACATGREQLADSTASAALTDKLAWSEGMIDVPGGRVWYRRIGSGPGTPLLALHGGPGGTSCRFEALAPLARQRPVIFYDQLGSGRSDHPSDTSLWHMARFVAELDAVRRALGLEQVHLLGHSWGGALAAEYMAAAKPTGVVSVIFSSPLIDTPRWIADADSLRAQLPTAIRTVLDEEERKGTLDSPAYRAATDSFYARHVRRLPVADEPRCAGVVSNDTIYRQMWGPTEFLSTGSLRQWSRAADLADITQPTLFVAGEFDEARPSTLEEFRRTMRDAQLVVIPGAAHAAMRERPAEYVAALDAFLARVERRPVP